MMYLHSTLSSIFNLIEDAPEKHGTIGQVMKQRVSKFRGQYIN